MRIERTTEYLNRIASCHDQHASGRWIVYRSEFGGGAALFAYASSPESGPLSQPGCKYPQWSSSSAVFRESVFGKDGEVEGIFHVSSGNSPIPTTPYLESEHMMRYRSGVHGCVTESHLPRQLSASPQVRAIPSASSSPRE